MAKLILSFESTVLKTFPLDKERVTIGRRPDNDIQVDNLAVSGLHAVVTTVHNDSVIEDQHSTNGTIINGQLIQKHILQNNDVIELGKHKLRFLAESAAPANYQNFAKTMVIRKPVAVATPAAEAVATEAPAPPVAAAALDMPTVVPAPAVMPMNAPATEKAPVPDAAAAQPIREAALQVLTGTATGRVLDLNKNLTTIGKAGTHVVVLTRRPVGYFVTHVEGDAPTRINGEPLGAQARQLNDQDTIEIAGTKMSFFYK